MLRRALHRSGLTGYPRTFVARPAKVSHTYSIRSIKCALPSHYSAGGQIKLLSRSFASHSSAHDLPKEPRTPPAYTVLELVCYINKPSTIEAAKSIEQEIRCALEVFSDPSVEIVAEQGWDMPEHRHPNTTLRRVGEQDLLTPWSQPLPNKGIRVITLRNQPVFTSLGDTEPDAAPQYIPAEPPRPPGYRVVRITSFVDKPTTFKAIKSVEEHIKECVDRVSDMATQFIHGEGWDLPQHVVPVALVHAGGNHIFKVWTSPPVCYEGETCASCDAFAGGVCVGPYRCSQDTTMRTFTLYAMMEMSKAAVEGLMADVERNPNVLGVMFREETEFPSMEGAKPIGEMAGLRRVG
ncbi:hypothetical protein LTR42_005269 [Elasticomyces elasticus]|nr:hypothetical protein LTR42_005269 [Elasticomyces elasticus]